MWRGSLGQLVNWGQGAGGGGGYARAPKQCAARSPLTILVSLRPVDQFTRRGAWHCECPNQVQRGLAEEFFGAPAVRARP